MKKNGERKRSSRSSQRGPSRHPHWKPCLIDSLTLYSNFLSTCRTDLEVISILPSRRDDFKVRLTSLGKVSSINKFGPCSSGPNAQIDRLANKSHPYLFWKCCPSCFGGIRMLTLPDSISSEIPLSRGSAIIVILFLYHSSRVSERNRE